MRTVTAKEQLDYINKMIPHAKTAAVLTGIPSPLILAWWSWETHWNTNNSSIKGNNHGGIKKNSKGSEYDVGQYAGYSSIDSFARDWARILNLNMAGYPKVIQTAKAGGSWEAITKAFNDSSYAEADYDVKIVLERAAAALKVMEGSPNSEVDNLKNEIKTLKSKLDKINIIINS